MDIIETGDNAHGLVGLSYDQNQTVLVYPDKNKGHVRIKNSEKSKYSRQTKLKVVVISIYYMA